MTSFHPGEVVYAFVRSAYGLNGTKQPRQFCDDTDCSSSTYYPLHLAAQVLNNQHRSKRATPPGRRSGAMKVCIVSRNASQPHRHLMIQSGDVRLAGSTGSARRLRARANHDGMHPRTLAQRLASIIPAALYLEVQAILDFLVWAREHTHSSSQTSGTEAESRLPKVRILFF
jgi:hypothetical protein